MKETPMSKKRTEPTKIIHRDSKDGEFVTKEYADKHKDTTEREKVRIKDK